MKATYDARTDTLTVVFKPGPWPKATRRSRA